jgi:hypothetical protein
LRKEGFICYTLFQKLMSMCDLKWGLETGGIEKWGGGRKFLVNYEKGG